MEAQLIYLMMRYEFWDKHKEFFSPELFPDNLQKIYQLILNAHNKHKKDITLADLKVLYYYTYPATTTAQWELIQKVLNDVPGELSEDVAKEVIQKAWLLEQARRITNFGADIINGKEADFEKIGAILEKVKQRSILDGDDLQQVGSELDDILEAINVTTRWKFNLEGLRKVASGIGPGIFCITAARTETGKTGFAVSLCAGKDGFADQGAVCHFYCNEESPQRTQGRAIMAYTEMPLQEILLDKENAVAKYANVKQNLKFFDVRGRSIYELRNHLRRSKADVVVIDQLDKLSIPGSYAREDERLGSLYMATRDISAESGVGIIALTQLNADSEGKTYVSSANLAGARTSKAAEGDLVFGIGKSPVHTENTRIINIIKNKVTGFHEDVVCLMRPEISRFVS